MITIVELFIGVLYTLYMFYLFRLKENNMFSFLFENMDIKWSYICSFKSYILCLIHYYTCTCLLKGGILDTLYYVHLYLSACSTADVTLFAVLNSEKKMNSVHSGFSIDLYEIACVHILSCLSLK